MNYSRNIKKASIGKRVLISWVVVAVIFFFAGFGIGMLCSKEDNTHESNTQKMILFFEKPGGKIFKNEMPGEWAEKLKFVLLDFPMQINESADF